MVVAANAGSRKRILMQRRRQRFLDIGTDQTDEHRQVLRLHSWQRSAPPSSAHLYPISHRGNQSTVSGTKVMIEQRDDHG